MDAYYTNEAHAANKLGQEIERVAADIEQTAAAIRLARLKVDYVLGQTLPHSRYASVSAEVQRDIAALAIRLNQHIDALNRLAGEADSYRSTGR